MQEKEYKLYGGEVTVTFRPESRFRYVITDPVKELSSARMRGVTTVLGDVLDKPGLRLWPRDMMARAVFGTKLVDKVPTYFEKEALIKPNTKYTEEELNKILQGSFNAHTKRSDRGKDIGTMVHSFVEGFLVGDFKELTDDLVKTAYPDMEDEYRRSTVKAVNGFVKWWNALENKEVLGVENMIYSREYKFSGTYDLKAKINGKVYMLDVKTTNASPSAPLGIYPEYFMQLGGYMLADNEESGQKFDDCGVINVGKDGKVKVATAGDMNVSVGECMASFSHAIAFHDWLQKLAPLVKDSRFNTHLGKE